MFKKYQKMKIINVTIYLFVICLFTACTKDEIDIDIAEDITGRYVMNKYTTVAYSGTTTVDYTEDPKYDDSYYLQLTRVDNVYVDVDIIHDEITYSYSKIRVYDQSDYFELLSIEDSNVDLNAKVTGNAISITVNYSEIDYDIFEGTKK